jgi:hypothetical protein
MSAVASMSEVAPRGAAIVMTREELGALIGAGPMGYAVYLLLRAAMDFRTGKVGESSSISLHELGAHLVREIPRGQGVQRETPTKKDVRMALDQLQRQGLIRRVGNDELLVFRLPMARTGNVRSFQTGHSAGTVCGDEPGTGNASNDGPLSAEPATNRAGVNGANWAHIRDQGSKPSTQAASTGERRVDAVDKSAAAGEISTMGTSTSKLIDVLRAEGVQVQTRSPTVFRWAWQGVTVALLKGAIRKARQRREEAGSAAPINVPLIDTIVTQDGQAVEQDWNKRAQAVGVAAKPGEAWPQFRRRVLDAEAGRRAPR